jgi:hypothetical protein
VQQVASSCQPTCNGETPPQQCSTSGNGGPVRLCTAKADCASDPNNYHNCCSFGNDPLYWCVKDNLAAAGTCIP